MKSIRWYGPSLVLLVTTLLVMVAGPGLMQRLVHAQTEARISLIKNSLEANQSLADLSKAFSEVAQAVEPSVVHISISRLRPAAGRFHQNDALRRFFDLPDQRQPQQRPRRERDEYERFNEPEKVGEGSGWVYDEQGHIITNNHVVENADQITIRFSDGSQREATVVGTDPKTDVAVLKIDNGSPLHPATVADRPVLQGEIVFAFGSPFRFAFSMSQGIVSAKGRQLGILRPAQGYENFIQTDAAINPGNSGGPLTNIQGQVVGMNTAIASRTGAYNGLGFAIPVDMVVRVVDQIIKSGAVSRGYLGIFIGELKPEMAQSLGFEDKGVLVVEATDPNSPAARAGIQADDIITHIEEYQVSDPDELRTIVADYAPGTKIDVTLFRDGETINVQVKLGRLPRAGAPLSGAIPDVEEDQPDAEGRDILQRLGIRSIETFTEATAQRLGVPFEAGVIIAQVRPSSIAAHKGLGRGTIITKVMGQSIATVDELIEALIDHDPDRPVRLRVKRWDRQQERFQGRSIAMSIPSDDKGDDDEKDSHDQP